MTNIAPTDPMAWLPTSDTPLGVAAAAYAAHGFRVVPLWRIIRIAGKPFRCECGDADCVENGPNHKHVGKHPCPKAWQKKASDDPDVVRDWWRRFTQRNIGMVMGGAGRLVAVDVDGPDGRASVAALDATHGPMPITLSSASGRDDGGEHRIFRLPEHLDIKRIKNRKFLPGLDVKANNGQIACAPSEHNTGRIYTWTVRAPVADMPEWLYDVMCMASGPSEPAPAESRPARAPLAPGSTATVRYVHRALEKACQDIATTSEGSRNEKLFAKSCTIFEYFHGERMDHAVALSELTAAGLACGLSKGEVHKVLTNAWEKASTGPGRRVPALAPPPAPDTNKPDTNKSPASSEPTAYPEDWDATTSTSTTSATAANPATWWNPDIRTDNHGVVVACEHNAILILRGDPRFAGTIAWDEFTQRALYNEQPLTDAAEVQILATLQRHYTVKFCKSHVVSAIMVVAAGNAIDTLKMKFDAFPAWDGTSRLDTLAAHRLRTPIADQNEHDYARIVVRKFLIQAVARAYEPGCQADATLMLIGAQGARKSTFVKLLGGAFFTDQVANINDEQKSANSLHGKHVVELAEMAAFKGISPQRVKQWLSLCADHYTPKYIRNAVTVLRRCVFVATTNHNTPLSDPTGERRFWPLHVGDIDVEGLREDMPQIWAEAIAAYRAGEKWHLTDAESALAKDAQSMSSGPDAWEQLIEDYLIRNPTPTIVDIITGALGLEKAKASPHEQSKIADILAKLGYHMTRPRAKDGKRPRTWTKVPTPVEPGTTGVSAVPARSIAFDSGSADMTTGSIGSIRNRDCTETGRGSAENNTAFTAPVVEKVFGGGWIQGPADPEGLTARNDSTPVGSTEAVDPLAVDREAPFADWVDAELGDGNPKT